jgi:hypothetical protein
MGQRIGFTNNAKDTTTAVDAHSYRLCLSVGVQSENAGFFLSREKDGLPQRFLWLPTNDPRAPRDRPEKVRPISVELPQFTLQDGAARVDMPVPDAVTAEIWLHRWRVLTGAPGVDPLDGHLKLTQLKVAAAVAILHGRTEVTDEDWAIAGHLVDVSARVRAGLQAAVQARRRRDNHAKAHDQADRQVIVEDQLTDERQRRVAKAILRKLERVGRATHLDLLRACNSKIREEFDPVLGRLIDDRIVVRCEGGVGRVKEYELAARSSA